MVEIKFFNFELEILEWEKSWMDVDVKTWKHEASYLVIFKYLETIMKKWKIEKYKKVEKFQIIYKLKKLQSFFFLIKF